MKLMKPVVAALLGLAAVSTSASAGDWGCGVCASYGYGQVYQAAPTYSYAAPTVTVVPNIVVQPNYVVQRTYVVRPTQFVQETPSCFFGCAPAYVNQGQLVVNQGQYVEGYTADPVIRGYRPRYYGHPYGHGIYSGHRIYSGSRYYSSSRSYSGPRSYSPRSYEHRSYPREW